MRSLLLRLEGPLQSWGTQGRFGIRDTDREPSKSGVLGLVGAALGMARDDGALLAQLRSLRMAVRVDREGQLLRDYHTVGGGVFRGEPHGLWSLHKRKKESGLTALTERYYLADASFLVALGTDDRALADRVAGALAAPKWPLFLGRRACAPSMPVFVRIVDMTPEDALLKEPLRLRQGEEMPARLRIILEANADEGRPRQDVPLSFELYGREHGLRHVRFDFLDTSSLPEAS
jgi:CRISPR system Cascade subunit CasD